VLQSLNVGAFPQQHQLCLSGAGALLASVIFVWHLKKLRQCIGNRSCAGRRLFQYDGVRSPALLCILICFTRLMRGLSFAHDDAVALVAG
jgi:hypothetical protein